MIITAEQVKELRGRTGVGMMECKKALVAAQGDIEKAIDEMRKAGIAKAAKKAGRIAAEGVVLVAYNHQRAAIVEVNCETDFVARDSNLISFADSVAQRALALHVNDVQVLLASELNGTTVDQLRSELVTKIGENINLRRCDVIAAGEGILGTYVHNHRIAVIVHLTGGNAELAHDIAMHIAASKPDVIRPEEVSAAKIARESEVFRAEAVESGKPADIIEKIVNGRINKLTAEISLVSQAFIKNPDLTVGDLLKQYKAQAVRFIRYELGEGIEKVAVDFHTEVMGQVTRSSLDGRCPQPSL